MAAVNFRYLLLIYVRILVRRRKRRRLQVGEAIRRRLPRYWVRPSLQKRKEQGCFHTLFKELRENDRENFFRFCKMSPESFDYLAYMVAAKISKKNNKILGTYLPRGTTLRNASLFGIRRGSTIIELFVPYR